MNDPDLFDVCRNRHGGNSNSAAAHRKTDKKQDRRRILDFIASREDATCDEAEQELGMNHQTCSARFTELKRDNLIAPTVKRPTRTGCKATAYRIVTQSA